MGTRIPVLKKRSTRSFAPAHPPRATGRGRGSAGHTHECSIRTPARYIAEEGARVTVNNFGGVGR